MNHNITLRPGLPTVLPEIATLDIATYPHHHMARLAWSNSSNTWPILLSRYELLFFYIFSALPSPSRHAGRGGWLCDLERMRKECGDHEDLEFKYQSPESANVGMITYFLGKNGELQKDLRIEGMAELEVLGVKPGHQRKRIGALLLEEVVKEVCKILF
jgi:hypothetical protein